MRRSADSLLRVYRSNDFLAVSFQSTFKPRHSGAFLHSRRLLLANAAVKRIAVAVATSREGQRTRNIFVLVGV